MSDRWEGHVRRAKAGDRQAIAELVEGNLGLVRRGAHRLAGYALEHEDLVAEGVVGLLEAVRAHDPARGTAYTTTAAHWIRLRQLGAVRAARSLGTVTRSQLAGRLWWWLPRVWDAAQCSPDPVGTLVSEIATRTGNRPSPDDALAAVQATRYPLVDIDSVDWLAGGGTPELAIEHAERDAIARMAFNRLSADERDVIERTIIRGEPMVVGRDRQSHSLRQREARIRRRALERLRAELSEAA